MNRLVAVLVALVLAAAAPAVAQGRGDRPGDFDFYVLSLSWSPSYCASEGDNADRLQCAGPRSYAFVVHGLWPQHERGYPSDCRTRERDPSRALVDAMLDIMPSPNLVRHEWRKHGTCSGLDAAGYFAELRNARNRVAIPPRFVRLDRYVTATPREIEAAFRTANPGLDADMIAVDCDRRFLREVRICMTKDLKFRSCTEVDRRACRQERVVMPPTREGGAAMLMPQ